MKPFLLIIVFITIHSNSIAQYESVSIISATNQGPYTTSTLTEFDGIRNGPDYYGATIYYPVNSTPPFACIAIVPGYISPESSIQNWGPFYASHGIVTMTIGTNSGFDQPETRAAALLDALETLRQENNRINSPLNGAIDENRFAVSGWSMGGGGAQIAATIDPSLKAIIALCPWLETSSTTSSTLNHTVPTLFFCGEYDGIASPSIHANTHYDYTPSTTDKILYEVDNGDHFVANDPGGGNGEVGRMALSWLKKYLLDDNCYCPLLLEVPVTASNYMTNITCESTSTSTQSIIFNEGWSIVSAYILPENTEFSNVIAPIVENIIIAKNYAGSTYLPDWGFNGIGEWQEGQGYLVKMSTTETIIIEGEQLMPENSPIDLLAGWNMIAYLRTEAASTDLVFSELAEAENLVIVKDYTGNVFLPDWDFNSIGNLEPGKGYQLKVNNASTLQYLANDLDLDYD